MANTSDPMLGSLARPCCRDSFVTLQSAGNDSLCLQEILGGGSLRSALNDLKLILQTPIKCFEAGGRHLPPVDMTGPGRREMADQGDIPSLFTKVMGKGRL